MRPILAIGDIQPGNVLYHSAFGFAAVQAVEGDLVRLRWDTTSDHLPAQLRGESLLRVFLACSRHGFFDQAMNEPDALREQLQTAPLDALHALLLDLDEAQRPDDLRDWIVGRNLLTTRGFARWWSRVQSLLGEDGRFSFTNGELSLATDAPVGPLDRLNNPLLPPARRIELARAYRTEIGEAEFQRNIFDAWRHGHGPVRDLALAAVGDLGADAVLSGLLDGSEASIDAIIHALRAGGWPPADVRREVRERLVARTLTPPPASNAPEAEGRLAAALWRWECPSLLPALANALSTSHGRTMLRSSWRSLPPRRAETFVLELLETAVAAGIQPPAWTAEWLTDHANEAPPQIARRVDGTFPRAASWLETQRDHRRDEFTEEALVTVEVERFVPTGPIRLSEATIQPDQFIATGVSLVRALARHHANGRHVHPSSASVHRLPDGSISVSEGAPAEAKRAPGERPSLAADVYSASITLIEALLGRSWPRNFPPEHALNFVRHAVPQLPPSALAPLHAALDPWPAERPRDAQAWLSAWEAALATEERRQATPSDFRHRWEIGYDTHIGRAKALHTQTNQDALYWSGQGPLQLMLVCDGISTADIGSGDVASGISAQVVASQWDQRLARLISGKHADAMDFLDQAFRLANRAVCDTSTRLAGGRIGDRAPMGTTAVAAVAQGNHVQIAWLGDSRAYIVGPYGASLLTADANQTGDRFFDWCRGAEPTLEPCGFALVRYLGHFDAYGHPTAIPAQHLGLTLLPGERLVLCSDGLTDYVAPHPARAATAIAAAAMHGTPDEAARRLVDLANRGGGGDNVTVIVAAAQPM